MISKRGILIHPEEVGDYWAEILVESDLNLVAIHPKGGPQLRTLLVTCWNL